VFTPRLGNCLSGAAVFVFKNFLFEKVEAKKDVRPFVHPSLG
jgi:hypothetical protein